MNIDKSDSTMIAVIMSGLPEAYNMVKTSLSGSSKLQTLTLDELETDIHNFYGTNIKKETKTYTFGKEDEKPSENDDKAMQASAGQGNKSFIKCFHCGRKGHRSSECFYNPNSSNYRGNARNGNGGGNNHANTAQSHSNGWQSGNNNGMRGRKCYNCGKYGHVASMCRAPGGGAHGGNQNNYNGGGNNNNNDGNNSNNEMSMFCGYCVDFRTCSDETRGEFCGFHGVTLDNSPCVEKWLCDSGATRHMTPNESMLINTTPINEKVTIGDKSTLRATMKGVAILDLGQGKRLTLNDVWVVPKLAKNLISETRLQKRNRIVKFNNYVEIHPMSNEDYANPTFGNPIRIINNDGNNESFHINVKERLQSANMTKSNEHGSENIPQLVDVNVAHECLGHISLDAIQTLARQYNWKLTGTFRSGCQGCAYAKSKQKNVPHNTTKRATQRGERLFIDLSGPFTKSLKGNKYWMMIVDDFTRKKWSFYLPSKDKLGIPLKHLITKLNNLGHRVRYVRMDNAGENKKYIEQVCTDVGAEPEHTAPNTPQFNGVVEKAFDIVKTKAIAMMEQAKMAMKMRDNLWAEATRTATYLANLTPHSANDKMMSSDQLWYGFEPKGYKYLRPFGQVGYVAYRGKFQSKFAPRSHKGVMVGYAESSSRDTYRMWNPDTNNIIETRDVKWAFWHGHHTYDPTASIDGFVSPKKTPTSKVRFGPNETVTYFKTQRGPPSVGTSNSNNDNESVSQDNDERSVTSDHSGIDNDIDEGILSTDNEDTDDIELSSDEDTTISNNNWNRVNGRLRPRTTSDYAATTSYASILRNRTLRNINRIKQQRAQNYFAALMDDEEEYDDDLSANLDGVHTAFMAMVSEHDVPQTVEEALSPINCDTWKPPIDKEAKHFKDKKVFTVLRDQEGIKHHLREEGRKPIKTKWVFTEKNTADGNLIPKARCTAKGYAQVEGVDYTESYSPVVSDVTARTVFKIGLDRDYCNVVYDVTAAFLNGKLEEEIYIELPLGFGYPAGTIAKLNNAMYGLVQSARQWMKLKKETMVRLGFRQCKVDPCLFIKDLKSREKLFVLVYVDDCAVVGPEKEAWNHIATIEKLMEIKILGELSKYNGAHYVINKKEESITITQTKLIDDIVSQVDCFTTNIPAEPGKTLHKSEDETIIDATRYRSMVGKLLYVNKVSRPEISNAVRELSQHFDKPNNSHWKQLFKVCSYLKCTRERGLCMRKCTNRPTQLTGYVDSNFATDVNDRRSTTGYIVTLGESVISWKSKKQGSTTLSSTEAKYVAISQCACELKFLSMLLKEMRVILKLPIMLREDNTGAIFLTSNDMMIQRTKHIDTRHHFVREMIANGEVSVKYIRSERNPANMMTRNLGS